MRKVNAFGLDREAKLPVYCVLGDVTSAMTLPRVWA